MYRPKSAFEHFVRETEQTMRNENAAASDADIRQVAESMWEALDPDHKQVSTRKHLICDFRDAALHN